MLNKGSVKRATDPLMSAALDELWRRIREIGPLPDAGNFDPLTVDDVLQAERSQMQYERRKAFIAAFSWAIPTPAAIEAIAQALGDRRVLEVGAGTGLWAALLASHGLPVIATDAALPPVLHHAVECLGGTEAIKTYREHEALMLCWPPFKDALAVNVLNAFQGDRVVSIGDVRFTAEPRFHATLETEWNLETSVSLPSWPGTQDGARLYGRL